MPATKGQSRSDQTHTAKTKAAKTEQARQQAIQQARLERDQKLAAANREQTLAVTELHSQFTARRKKIWAEFHDTMRKHRKDRA